MSSEMVFRRLQALARSSADRHRTRAPTQEYLVRHSLESFLDRLHRSAHAESFVLKGGILLGAYGVRRPTKDIDANAVDTGLTLENLTAIVRDVAEITADDGLEFSLDSLTVQTIRDDAEYPGLRVRVGVRIARWTGVVTWDVSTGDPVVPAPRLLTLERILGPPIVMMGYAAESIVAEKGVTIVERGLSSTRWRDYLDIVALGRQGVDPEALHLAVRTVAIHRRVSVQPVAAVLTGYGQLHQARWAAWRRKEGLEDACEANLDDQISRVSAILDPVFARIVE